MRSPVEVVEDVVQDLSADMGRVMATQPSDVRAGVLSIQTNQLTVLMRVRAALKEEGYE